MNKAYILNVDYSQIVDDQPNIHKIKEDDYLDLSQVLASEKHEINEKEIIMRADFNQIVKYDFVQNELNIPIVSQKFIDALKINQLEYMQLISIILLDETVPPNKIFKLLGNGVRKEVSRNTNFYTLKFNNQFDYCDKENSTFRKLRSQPDSLGILKKTVLKEPANGFPSLFRIKESVSKLFLSAQAKEALESNNIKGCVFEEVEVTPYNS